MLQWSTELYIYWPSSISLISIYGVLCPVLHFRDIFLSFQMCFAPFCFKTSSHVIASQYFFLVFFSSLCYLRIYIFFFSSLFIAPAAPGILFRLFGSLSSMERFSWVSAGRKLPSHGWDPDVYCEAMCLRQLSAYAVLFLCIKFSVFAKLEN